MSTLHRRELIALAAAPAALWLTAAAHAQSGACCFEQDMAAACIETDAQDCQETGGAYLGDGTSCATSECHVAPWSMVLDNRRITLELPLFDTIEGSRVLQSVAGRINAQSTHVLALTVSPDRETCVTAIESRVDVRVQIDASSDDVMQWPALMPLSIDSGFPWMPGPAEPRYCGDPEVDPTAPVICPADLGGPEMCNYGGPFGYPGADGFLIETQAGFSAFAVDGQQTFILNIDGQSFFIPYASLTQFSNPVSEAEGNIVLGYSFELIEGACCLSEDQCVVMTRPQCNSMGGFYRGDDSLCVQPNICGGACCFPDGCAVMQPNECASMGGSFIAFGTDCTFPTECPAPCCFEDSTCEEIPQTDCADVCGTIGAIGEECPQICQFITPGACCLPDGSCAQICQQPCEDAGGVFQGQGTECDDVDCPEPTCPADLDDNGVVDVFDLFILLGAWGGCADPCPPACLGDLADEGDNVTNCAVDVFDLFVLLNAWGPCE